MASRGFVQTSCVIAHSGEALVTLADGATRTALSLPKKSTKCHSFLGQVRHWPGGFLEIFVYSGRQSAIGQLNEFKPVTAQAAHYVNKGVERNRLGNERVNSKIICAQNIFFGLGRGEHDYWDPT